METCEYQIRLVYLKTLSSTTELRSECEEPQTSKTTPIGSGSWRSFTSQPHEGSSLPHDTQNLPTDLRTRSYGTFAAPGPIRNHCKAKPGDVLARTWPWPAVSCLWPLSTRPRTEVLDPAFAMRTLVTSGMESRCKIDRLNPCVATLAA